MTLTELFAFYLLPGAVALFGFGLGIYFRVRAKRRKPPQSAQATFNFGNHYKSSW